MQATIKLHEMSGKRRDVLVVLQRHAPLTYGGVREQFARETGHIWSDQGLRDALDALVEDGLLVRDGGEYRLTDDGEAALAAYERWMQNA